MIIGIVWLKYEFMGPNFTREANRQTDCLNNVQEIGGALSRYAVRNQKYPEKLADLYPEFLENRSALHCPSDPSPSSTVSYDYFPPKIDSPDSTIVLTCRRHALMKGISTIVILTKGGDVSVKPLQPVFSKPETADKQEKKSSPKTGGVKAAPSR
jgi:hypothetical protein